MATLEVVGKGFQGWLLRASSGLSEERGKERERETERESLFLLLLLL